MTPAEEVDYIVGEPKWPKDNSSDFESDSPPSSPILSSGYESIISEDLNLYDLEARCVC
jgi:hypothetical protein